MEPSTPEDISERCTPDAQAQRVVRSLDGGPEKDSDEPRDDRKHSLDRQHRVPGHWVSKEPASQEDRRIT